MVCFVLNLKENTLHLKNIRILRQFFIVLFFILFSGQYLKAQNKLEFKVGLKDLPSEKIGNMIRDQEGFLWFVYYGGVGKYDGHEVKYYTPGENSISGPGATSIVMDEDGILWILTKDNGLNKYDKETDKFTYFKHDPNNKNSINSNISESFGPQRLFVGQKNRILIGTMGGFDIYDKTNNVFKHHVNDPDNPNSLSSNNVTSVIQGKDGIIWIGTFADGLNRFDESTGSWTRYQHKSGSDKGPASDMIWSLLEDSDGTLWVGTSSKGLSRFDKETETFSHYRHDPDNPKSLGDDKIYYLYEDSAGSIWVTHKFSDKVGLEMFNKEKNEFTRFSADPKSPSSISSNGITTVYEDPVTGIFWIINQHKDVFDKYDKESHKFRLHQHDPANPASIASQIVLAMHEDNKQRLIISVMGGLEIYDQTTVTFSHFPYEKMSPIMGDLTVAMYQDDDNVMWLIDNKGVLTKLDINSMKPVKHYVHDPNDSDTIMASTSTGGNIIKDRDNPDILWLALSSVMERFNKTSEKFTHFVYDADDLTSISQGNVWSVYDDGKGFIWVSAFGGLSRLDKLTRTFTRFVHNPDNPESIGFTKQATVFEDSLGNFWICGLTNGIDLLDRKAGIFKHFNKENGFPAIGVNLTIQEDGAGHLWIGTTDNGLIKFDIKTQKVISVYSKSDGLQGKNFWRSYKKKDGQMWFGGGFGVNSFYPDQVKKNPNIPPVVLTSFTQGGEKINLGKAPERLKEVTLGWKDNFFEFKFAALNYTKPEKNRYKYMLMGRDKDWYYSEANPSGRYTGLEGGSYTLKLKGSNNDGVWNEEGVSLKINVLFPFWKTGWFYSILTFGFLLIIGCTILYLKRLKVEISDRKKAETALLKSEKEYRDLVNKAPDLRYRTDMEGRIIFISESVYNLSGFTVEEAVGLKMAEEIYANPEEREYFLKALQKKGYVSDFEAQLKRKDGSIWWASTNAYFYKDPNGNIQGVEGVTRDVTERKLTEQALHNEMEFTKTALNSQKDTFFLFDPADGKTIRWNQAFRDITGYTDDEISDLKAPDSYYSHEDLGRAAALIENVLKTGVGRIELDLICKDGRRVPTEYNVSAVVDDKGAPQYFISIGRDITDRKQAEDEKEKLEAQLLQAQKMESVGFLAGGIAHDFNNILFPIMGHTEMLLEDVSEDSAFRDSLNKIYSGALRARDLVKQILTFSRQESHELKLIKMQIVVRDALKLIRSTIPSTIDIKQDLQADCGEVMADPTQIHQIVMNLTTNAYHAMQNQANGYELKINLKEIELEKQDLMDPKMEPGFFARLTIADQGMGIDKKLTTKIFDPFFTTKEKGKGTGMGLAVVHGIVKSMNGAIQVYSEPGKGTEFKIYFPIQKNSFVRQNHPRKPTIHGGTEHILLVDDEEAILSMEKQVLERLGYKVTTCISSIEAVEIFCSNPYKFDLVITDMAMPDLPGDKLSCELTQIRPDIPILLCTGFSETMSEEKTASSGIKGFLMKPIIMKDLSQKIREVLDGTKNAFKDK